jgi:EmrB/QacA subfamily drug resistance transporter
MVGVMIAASFCMNCTITILTVLLPDLAVEFNVSNSIIAWVTIGPMVASAMLSPAAGKFGDIFGRKKTWAFGFVVMIISLAISAAARTAWVLIFGRVMQGMGQAFQMPSDNAIIQASFPKDQRGTVIGIRSGFQVLGPAVGVVAGGLIVEAVGWRSMFIGPLIVVTPLFIVGLFIVKSPPNTSVRGQQKQFDLIGALLLAISVSTTLFVVNQGPTFGWGSAVIIITSIAAAAFTFFLVKYEAAHKDIAILPPDFFGNLSVLMVTFLRCSCSFCYMGFFIAMPFYLRQVLGYSLVDASIILSSRPIVGVFLNPICGRLTKVVACEKLIFLGYLLGLISYVVYFFILQEEADVAVIIVGLVLQGFSQFTMSAPCTTFVVNSVPERIFGNVAGIMSMLMTLSMSTGMAVVITIIAGSCPGSHENGTRAVTAVNASSAKCGYNSVKSYHNVAILCVAMLSLGAPVVVKLLVNDLRGHGITARMDAREEEKGIKALDADSERELQKCEAGAATRV